MADGNVGSAAPQAATAASSAPVQDNNTESTESQENVSQTGGAVETVSDLKDQAQNGTPAEKVQAKKMLKSLKIKFNGREFDEELPFEIPDDPKSVDYMKSKLQMDRLARTKAQEFSSLEKEVRAFVEELRKNPKKALSNPDVGIDLKKLAAEIIEEEISNSQKSPEQLQREKLEAELKSMKEEREKEKEDNKKKEFERLQEQEYERYDLQMTKALEGSKLPKSPYIVKKMAEYMMLGLQNNLDVTPQDVLPLVEEEMQNDLKEMFAVMPEEVIESIVGKDTINKIRKRNVSKAKAGNTPPIPVKEAVKDVAGKAPSKDVTKKQNYRSFFGT